MIPQHRVVDFSIGLSILGWGLFGTWSNLGHRPLAILSVTSLLHVMVGALFLRRTRADSQGGYKACLLAIPAVLVGGWVFRFSPSQWNVAAQVVYVVSGGFVKLSFATLGRRFAVLPANRGTETRGPYSLVRHPAYLGELGMVIACLLARTPGLGQLTCLVIVIGLFAMRIRAEEGLLRADKTYQGYCRRVRWRLVPLIW